VIGFVSNSQRAVAQNQQGETVTINPAQLPLPVKGSLGISGTVAATQSGAWNVGLTGTPNVNVANPATAPALTLDISKSASQHVQLICFKVYLNCLEGSAQTPYVVPTGQNLIVTSVDVFAVGVGDVIFEFPGPVGFGRIWIYPGDGFTHSFQYPSGIVFAAGYTFAGNNVTFGSTSQAILQGFLTPV